MRRGYTHLWRLPELLPKRMSPVTIILLALVAILITIAIGFASGVAHGGAG
jgi:hypothetical protein